LVKPCRKEKKEGKEERRCTYLLPPERRREAALFHRRGEEERPLLKGCRRVSEEREPNLIKKRECFPFLSEERKPQLSRVGACTRKGGREQVPFILFRKKVFLKSGEGKKKRWSRNNPELETGKGGRGDKISHFSGGRNKNSLRGKFVARGKAKKKKREEKEISIFIRGKKERHKATSNEKGGERGENGEGGAANRAGKHIGERRKRKSALPLLRKKSEATASFYELKRGGKGGKLR